MAKIAFSAQYQYWIRLQRMEKLAASDNFLNQAVKAGAAPVADAIRAKLNDVPDEKFRYLAEQGEKFNVVSRNMKKDIADNFGLTPIDRDKWGFVHTKAGFEGYSSHPTKGYPKGVPIPMVARAIESGSSVREKYPFVYPAVRATSKAAISEMEKYIDDAMEKIFKE